MILQRGVSRFDGKEFVVVASNLDWKSKNKKTGPMVQLTILATEEVPHNWNSSLQDKSTEHTVCGDCPLSRGGCYVNLHASITSIWKKFKAGTYPALELAKLAGKAIRFGAWGEPSLIELPLMSKIASVAKNWTGYTHQWSKDWAQGYKAFLMASVESVESKSQANAKGWRTFRIVKSESAILPDEVLCPATTNRKIPVQCVTCGLCKGNSIRAKNVAVVAHGGIGALKAFKKMEGM